ncbi:MAG: Rrf2 family transcriptional regulator, nitric oxide-sensitive transcriptional repressor [Pseudomonadota bacterium]|nr:Rrf2 family transcriptional regulator, nitric oxide-sensitive transcriptional repressor [Pseudomonadota bacterium]
MRLSLQTDYALRTLMFLAVKDGHHSIADIASAYGISKNHLMKVAQRLTAEGFVESVRGRSGGLKLALPPAELNVGVIVRTMEDTGAFVECFDPATNTCVVTPVCGLRHVLTGALESFARHLDQFSIADLIPKKERFERQLDGGARGSHDARHTGTQILNPAVFR